ncbi:MAG: fluoride efflux transporter CrcB [Alphaproteobacteria bacterium]|nr:fluoride efflux transporter CrcB [Alphaproteobacteria bacterium]
MKLVLAVALGGAIGSVARHFVAGRITHLYGTAFPWGILTVNVVGSLIMGVLAEAMALKWDVSAETRAFLTVGILGGFTTFSSFSLDVAVLVERGETLNAALYIALSVIASVAALFAGLHLARVVLG